MKIQEGDTTVEFVGMTNSDFRRLSAFMRGKVSGSPVLSIRADVGGFLARNRIKCDSYEITKN